jgi:hypothetical protein
MKTRKEINGFPSILVFLRNHPNPRKNLQMAEQCTHFALTFEGNFCSSCGQKKIKCINRKYLWEEIQYTLLYTNKGLLYSLKKIARNPGKTAREFIEDDQASHYKSILPVFFTERFFNVHLL